MRQIKVKGLLPNSIQQDRLLLLATCCNAALFDQLVGVTILRAHPQPICAPYLPRVVSRGSAAAAFWAASRLSTSS